MKLVRHHPFVLLALVTIAIGALWHSSVVPTSLRGPLDGPVTLIGWPFMTAMRLSRAMIGSSALVPVAGTLLGVLPYVLADAALRAWSRRKATST